MFRKFYPDACAESAYEVDYGKLCAQGVRGLIFDIDNTLVEHGAPATERVRELFSRLHGMGFEICLISNNKEPRVAPFAAESGADHYVCDAHKPSRANYIKAMELMGTDIRSTRFIGDQLFTDVYGANRTGIPSILVRPIHPKEEFQIVLKRKLEKIVLFFYKRYNRKRAGSGT